MYCRKPPTYFTYSVGCKIVFFFLVLFLSRNVYELRVTTEVANCRKVCVPIKKLLRPRSDSISYSFSCLRSRWDFAHEDVQKQSRGRRGNLNTQHSPLGFASFELCLRAKQSTRARNTGTPAPRHPGNTATRQPGNPAPRQPGNPCREPLPLDITTR